MDNKFINKELRFKAISLGLCEQWQGQWSTDWSEGKMIAKYKEGIDFCLANNFPSNQFIKNNFSKEALREGGVLIDERYSVVDRRCLVIKGSSDIKARYNGRYMGSVYLTDNAVLHLYARNESHVIVHILDKASVVAEQYDNARVLLIRHSPECEIITKGNIEVKDEFDWLK